MRIIPICDKNIYNPYRSNSQPVSQVSFGAVINSGNTKQQVTLFSKIVTKLTSFLKKRIPEKPAYKSAYLFPEVQAVKEFEANTRFRGTSQEAMAKLHGIGLGEPDITKEMRKQEALSAIKAMEANSKYQGTSQESLSKIYGIERKDSEITEQFRKLEQFNPLINSINQAEKGAKFQGTSQETMAKLHGINGEESEISKQLKTLEALNPIIKTVMVAEKSAKYQKTTQEAMAKLHGIGLGESDITKEMRKQEALSLIKAMEAKSKYQGTSQESLSKIYGIEREDSEITKQFRKLEQFNPLINSIKLAEKRAKFQGTSQEALRDLYGIGFENPELKKYFLELEKTSYQEFLAKKQAILSLLNPIKQHAAKREEEAAKKLAKEQEIRLKKEKEFQEICFKASCDDTFLKSLIKNSAPEMLEKMFIPRRGMYSLLIRPVFFNKDAERVENAHRRLKDILSELKQRSPKILANILTQPDSKGNLYAHYYYGTKEMQIVHDALKDQPEVIAKMYSTKNNEGLYPFQNIFMDYAYIFCQDESYAVSGLQRPNTNFIGHADVPYISVQDFMANVQHWFTDEMMRIVKELPVYYKTKALNIIKPVLNIAKDPKNYFGCAIQALKLTPTKIITSNQIKDFFDTAPDMSFAIKALLTTSKTKSGNDKLIHHILKDDFNYRSFKIARYISNPDSLAQILLTKDMDGNLISHKYHFNGYKLGLSKEMCRKIYSAPDNKGILAINKASGSLESVYESFLAHNDLDFFIEILSQEGLLHHCKNFYNSRKLPLDKIIELYKGKTALLKKIFLTKNTNGNLFAHELPISSLVEQLNQAFINNGFQQELIEMHSTLNSTGNLIIHGNDHRGYYAADLVKALKDIEGGPELLKKILLQPDATGKYLPIFDYIKSTHQWDFLLYPEATTKGTIDFSRDPEFIPELYRKGLEMDAKKAAREHNNGFIIRSL